jgi:succinate dehydrogenase flavin-adding protein (antitoxin of CptAB toxin-antitoxin module)
LHDEKIILLKGRRNHIVPQVYLNLFTDEDRKLYRWRLNPKNPHEKPISNPKPTKSLAFEWDIYTIDRDTMSENLEIEPGDDQFVEDNCFTFLENNLSKIITDLTQLKADLAARGRILDFIVLSVFRNPRILELFLNNYNPDDILKGQKESLEKLFPERSFESIQREIKNYITKNPKYSRSNLAKNYQLGSLIRLHQNKEDQNRDKFNQNLTRNWKIFEATGDLNFITSNNPAFSHWGAKGFNNNLMPESTFFLPLTPQYYLTIDEIAEKMETPLTKIAANNDLVDLLNFMTIKGSKGELFSGKRGMLERYMDQSRMEFLQKKYDLFVKMDISQKNV